MEHFDNNTKLDLLNHVLAVAFRDGNMTISCITARDSFCSRNTIISVHHVLVYAKRLQGTMKYYRHYY